MIPQKVATASVAIFSYHTRTLMVLCSCFSKNSTLNPNTWNIVLCGHNHAHFRNIDEKVEHPSSFVFG